MDNDILKKPQWLRVKLPTGYRYKRLDEIVTKYNLNTICRSGKCPNMGECWSSGTATFMILGNICTRSCAFCGVKTGRPKSIDWSEPDKVAKSINLMKINHVVITSVDRDDIKDKGSIIWKETINSIKRMNPHVTIEALIPDFQGDKKCIDRIILTKPNVISHNMETVRRLTREVRIQAKYERSIEVLKYLKENGTSLTKTGIMLGLGEKHEEVIETIHDIFYANVDIITIGQYLQPSKNHLPVKSYISLDKFKIYKDLCMKLGFKHSEVGPLVRSSYRAHKHIN